MRLLELFSGTGSVGRAFEARGWEVTSLDSNPKADPTICSDILHWDFKAFESGYFDMIWASPCCTEFSIALKKRPRNLPLGDALVLKTLEIIDYLQPRWWAIENPSTGRLKSRPYMQGLHWDKVTYCKYGFRYKKPTAIWHNLPWTPSQGPCRTGDRCEAFQGTRHPETAQRGPTKGREGSNSRDQLYSIPPALCDEIVRLFKTPEYTVKQPPDTAVCKPPANGILCAPSASGKTVLLVSMILEQYRGCFERIFVFSPSVEVDSAWQPVKDYIRDELGVNTDREQCWWEDWDEAALRKIISDQKRITQKSKELGLKKLYSVMIVLDDHADNPAVHRKTGDGVLDTLFIRGRHFCINTWVSTQKLRLMSSAVRVNVMFYCVFRLRNQ
ncbi:putative DNA (cytosine-5)-methyltransferase, partial [Symbiodinium microadriaticum]